MNWCPRCWYAKTFASTGLKCIVSLSFYCQSKAKNWGNLMRQAYKLFRKKISLWNYWVISVFIPESYKALSSVLFRSGFQNIFAMTHSIKKKIPFTSQSRSYSFIPSVSTDHLLYAKYYSQQTTVVNRQEVRTKALALKDLTCRWSIW